MNPPDRAPRASGTKRADGLRHDAGRYFRAAGCSDCADLALCGGLNNGSLLNCMINCCGMPDKCTWVCRRNPLFRSHVRELRGLSLGNVMVTGSPAPALLAPYAPMIYHGYRRTEPLEAPVVAIKLAQMFDKRTGAPRFTSREELLRGFGIAETSRIIVSGVDNDPVIERWWAIGRNARLQIIGGFRTMGIDLVTAPNFSVCLNWPRTSDLAAMKRITICYAEFINAGQAATLHVNGRTDRDFEHWSEFISERDAVTHLSYEFTTGAAHGETRDRHIEWIRDLARRAPRPLSLVLYGDNRVPEALSGDFASITWIDTTTFMKTVKRFVAVREGNDGLAWQRAPTQALEPLNGRLAANVRERREWYGLRRPVSERT